MKHLIILLVAILSLGSAYAQNSSKTNFEIGEIVAPEGALISFEKQSFDFGELQEGPKVNTDFIFTNIGTEPLILSNVKASCGCTVPSWPKEPVMPGESSNISVTYNTANRSGNFNKAITITSNAADGPSKVIYIKGKVIKGLEEETSPVKQPSMLSPVIK